jgi:5-methyltetrahydropteroyltriglutamate--homocysteine methyltransferase
MTLPHVDHVGSLLRPQALKDARERLIGPQSPTENLGAHDVAELRKIEDGFVTEVVRLQEDAGLKIVTDGEFRRRSWWSDFFLSLGGVTVSYLGTSPIKFINAAGEERPMPGIRVTGKIEWKSSVNVAPFRFLKSAARRATPKVCLPTPSFIYFLRDIEIDRKAYPDVEQFWKDIVAAYRAEIAALADAGCRHVQLDEVMLTFLCDPRHREVSRKRGEDPDALAAKFVDVTNAIVARRPPGMTVTMHMCRGNLSAYWGAEGSYDTIADKAFGGLDVDGFLLEYDTPRAGDFAPLRHVGRGKTAFLGLMSTKETRLETPDELKRRIDAAAKIVPLDRLGLCPQCGFSTNVWGTHFTIDDERRKLERLVEVAGSVWGAA